MRIFAITVGRNETGRYLEQVLRWTSRFVDRHLYYDDWSTDDSLDVAIACGCIPVMRDRDVPAFLQHEASFREAAWGVLASVFDPTEDDWVLSIDADEFLMAAGDERAALEKNIVDARAGGYNALTLPINEVFGLDDAGRPLVRTDGFWGSITGDRIARWNHDHTFKYVPLGGGSLPLAATPKVQATFVELLHMGYAAEADRERKYQRYSTRGGAHSSSHIESILRPGTLVPWTGELPWRSA